MVDTLGLPLAVAVHEANLHDSKGTPQAIVKVEYKFPRLAKILADGGIKVLSETGARNNSGWVVEVFLRPAECQVKFPVLPKQWIVERPFSWLENFRRLTIDFEDLAETDEAIVQLAFVQIMLNKFIQCFQNSF